MSDTELLDLANKTRNRSRTGHEGNTGFNLERMGGCPSVSNLLCMLDTRNITKCHTHTAASAWLQTHPFSRIRTRLETNFSKATRSSYDWNRIAKDDACLYASDSGTWYRTHNRHIIFQNLLDTRAQPQNCFC